MRKLLKWIGIVLSGLVALFLLVAGVVYAWTEVQFNRTYNIQPESLEISSDEEAVARGRRWESVDLHAS